MKITNWDVTPYGMGESLVRAMVCHKGLKLHVATRVGPGEPVVFSVLVPEIRKSVLKAIRLRREAVAKKRDAARKRVREGRESPTPLPAMRASVWRTNL